MSIFILITLILLIPLIIVSVVFDIRHSHKLKVLSEKIEVAQGGQKAMLRSLFEKMEKMEMYREAAVSAKNHDVRKLFKTFMEDEERHLDMLKDMLSS